MQVGFDFAEGRAGPIPQTGGGVIGAMGKVEQHPIRRSGFAHGIIRQHKFFELGVITRSGWRDFRFRKSLRLWICVGVENWFWHHPVPGPKPKATHLMRIRFACNRIRQMRDSTGMLWRTSPRKAGYGQIEAAPEKM